ncbi:chromosome segregation protein SMC [Opitutales bacterium ASA1]|uniref:chromosome segregation protein SMC n=1 Tax=Congregicoccus parvus TaxID=3081749 RepID=UPI002B2BFC31|nr:chromosome segregation protein SMC [Opitutales bacterium ASA1]
MHLRALKINGFKSFADTTELKFDPGVTAIVGPNGCGKSNIADAIRWVLGEQSAKALRGGNMQDVIFSGTDRRKPLPLCEVSLLLTNCEEQLGMEFHEVEITRRVMRDGGGEYLINGRQCRLKDIQKLFMDTGVGRTSYSIMAQGQIDQILSSKPEERRAVFEEAAGITKYKSQRREALNKLGLVDQNLSRVTDVINEVGRQIGSLRRQASKALRFKRLSHRLRHLDLALGGHTYEVLSGAIGELETVAGQRSDEAGRFQAELEEKETTLADRKAERSRLLHRVQEAQQAVFDLRSQREQASNGANLADIRRNGLEERIEQSRQELEAVQAQLAELEERADASTQDKQMQLGILGDSDEVFRVRNSDLQSIEARQREAETGIQQLKYRLLEAESALVRLRNDCANLEVEDRTAQARRERLAEEFAEQDSAEARAREAVQLAQEQVEGARQRQNEAHEAVAAAQASIAQLGAEFKDAQRRIQELDRSIAQKSARQKLLQQLQEKLEGFGEGAKALIQGRLGGPFEGRRFAALSEGLKVQPRWVRAVETLLGAAVEAIMVDDGDTARAILDHLAERKLGRACLRFPVPVGSDVGSGVSVPLPETILPAASVLAVEAGQESTHPAASLLAGSYVADTAGAFLDFWRANPAFAFTLVATLDGQLVDRRGLVFGGQQKGGSGILQRTADLKAIAAEIERDQQALGALREAAEGIGRRLDEAERALEDRRREHVEATRQAAGVAAEERNALRAQQETEAKRARLDREQASIEEIHQRAIERLEKARVQFAEGDARVGGFKEQIDNAEKSLAALRAERDVKLEALSQARFDLAEKKQRLEVLNRGLSEIASRRSSLQESRTSRMREIDVWTEQIAQLADEAAAQRARAEECAHTLEVAQTTVASTRAELVRIEESLQVLEREQAYLRENSDSLRSSLSKVQVDLAEKRARLQFLQEEASREHQVGLQSVHWRYELWMAGRQPEGIKALDLDDDGDEDSPAPAAMPTASGAEPTATSPEGAEDARPVAPKAQPTPEELAKFEQTDWNAVRAEVQALRQRIQSMGPVNLVAIEEYGELKQRFEFLKAQCDDLTNSKNELLKAIDEINQTSQRQFADTFAQIRRNFEQTFKTLFSGGHADLILQETDDVLESGIEIVAQPPGTRLRGVSLLSGGQKTMTAVGLLFAIYMVKPSPFCVLDELDAPLDESNIGRFTTLLRQFTSSSQFIIITHNKRTIAASQSIYGVTMEERGVSKIVSMRFHTEHEQPDMVQLSVSRTATAEKETEAAPAASE